MYNKKKEEKFMFHFIYYHDMVSLQTCRPNIILVDYPVLGRVAF